ncbi:MAG: hypothetical protein CMJ83_02235 [Planctomycetes bacterium]|nr:hypothetical protein [Planctomycetota bacterium]
MHRALLPIAVAAVLAPTIVAQEAGKLIPNARALKCGCRSGGPRNYHGTDPNWVAVERRDVPIVLEGIVRQSFAAAEDWPWTHDGHDVCIFLALDPKYTHLHSDGNRVVSGERILEAEWEINYFPPRFWPAAGDRAWLIGRWVFDCAHPPYRTEMHPPKGVAFTRLAPMLLPEDATPSLVHRVRVYFHGQGGYFYDPVEGTNYEFDVPLPPKPSPDARLRAEIIDLPFGGPAPRLTPLPVSAPTRVHVVYPLASHKPTAKRWNIFAQRRASEASGQARAEFTLGRPRGTPRFAADIAVGWSEHVPTIAYRTIRITLDSIEILSDHDVIASGEWNLWIRVNGDWSHVPGLRDVDDDDVVKIGRVVDVIVPEDGQVVLQTTGWESDSDSLMGVGLQPKLPDPRLLDRNTRLGHVLRSFAKADAFGVGKHRDLSTAKDFVLRYRIEELRHWRKGVPR